MPIMICRFYLKLGVALLLIQVVSFGAIEKVTISPLGPSEDAATCRRELAKPATRNDSPSPGNYFKRTYQSSGTNYEGKILDSGQVIFSASGKELQRFTPATKCSAERVGCYLLDYPSPVIAVSEPSEDAKRTRISVTQISLPARGSEQTWSFDFSAADLPWEPKELFNIHIKNKAQGLYSKRNLGLGEIDWGTVQRYPKEAYNDAIMGLFKLDLKEAFFFRGLSKRAPSMLIPVYFDVFFDIQVTGPGQIGNRMLSTRHYLLVDWASGQARLDWVPFPARDVERSPVKPHSQTHALGISFTKIESKLLETGDLNRPIPFRSQDGRQLVLNLSPRGVVSVLDIDASPPSLIEQINLEIPYRTEGIVTHPRITHYGNGIQVEGITSLLERETTDPYDWARKVQTAAPVRFSFFVRY